MHPVFTEAAEILEFFAAMQEGKQERIRGDAENLLQHEGAEDAFQMIDRAPSHAGIVSPAEFWGDKLFKVDMLFQERNELGFMLFHGLGHTVVDVPKGCLHG